MTSAKELRPAAPARIGDFAISAGMLMFGTLIARALGLGVTPLITRIYSPAEIGAAALVISTCSLIGRTATMHLDMAIVSAPTNRQATELVHLIPILALPVAAILSFLFLLAILGGCDGYDVLPWPAALAGLTYGMLITAALVLRAWSIRRHDFRLLNVVGLSQSGLSALLRPLLGLIKPIWPTLVLSEMCAVTVAVYLLHRYGWQKASRARRNFTMSKARQRMLLIRYKHFPLFLLPSSLLDNTSNYFQIPVAIALYGQAAAGHYAFTLTLYQGATGVVIDGVADAFHGHFGQIARTNPVACRQLFCNTLAWLTLAGVVIIVGGFSVAGPIFVYIFGQKWAQAAEFARPLALWMGAAVIVGPLSRILLVFPGQRVKLVYDSLTFVCVILTCLACWKFHLSAQSFVVALSLVNTGCYAIYLLGIWLTVRRFTSPSKTRDDGVRNDC